MGLHSLCTDDAMDDARRLLVEQARAGKAAAWEPPRAGGADAVRGLFRPRYPRLVAYAARRSFPDAADDIVAETMTRAVESIDQFRWGRAGFDGWVFGIARRVSAEHARRETGAARPPPH